MKESIEHVLQEIANDGLKKRLNSLQICHLFELKPRQDSQRRHKKLKTLLPSGECFIMQFVIA